MSLSLTAGHGAQGTFSRAEKEQIGVGEVLLSPSPAPTQCSQSTSGGLLRVRAQTRLFLRGSRTYWGARPASGCRGERGEGGREEGGEGSCPGFLECSWVRFQPASGRLPRGGPLYLLLKPQFLEPCLQHGDGVQPVLGTRLLSQGPTFPPLLCALRRGGCPLGQQLGS